jgi:hypothetical protein
VDKSIAAVTTEMFALLEPCSTEERQRVTKAVFALLGDDLPLGAGVPSRATGGRATGSDPSETANSDLVLGPRARSWARQHKLADNDLEKVFYFHEGKVDIHVNEAPGNSKREQTINCYLLLGLRSFLENDASSFSDSDAMALCKHTGAYDKNNHPKFRNALGNLVTGSKENGFELAGPGLKAIGELIAERGKEEK